MIANLVQAYTHSSNRLLLLDYDGVLSPIVDRPEQAVPSDELLALLSAISSQPQTTLVVVSGRDRATLDAWLGRLPIDMAAEHGHFTKTRDKWHAAVSQDVSWQNEVAAEMQRLVDEHPGSHIEKKTASLVWHYRQADKSIDQAAMTQRISNVVRERADVMPGKYVIDVRAPGASKGTAIQQWYGEKEWDFVLCIGDDTTDEAMFAALPSSAWTIHVGVGMSAAQYQLRQQKEVTVLLKQLAAEL